MVVAGDGVIRILTGIRRIQKHVPSVISGGTSSSGFRCESVPIGARSTAAIEDSTFVNMCIIEYFSFLVTISDLNVNLFIDTILDLGHFLSSEEPTVVLSVRKLGLGKSLNKFSRKSRVTPHNISYGRVTDIIVKRTITRLNHVSGDQMTCLGVGVLTSNEHINDTISGAC